MSWIWCVQLLHTDSFLDAHFAQSISDSLDRIMTYRITSGTIVHYDTLCIASVTHLHAFFHAFQRRRKRTAQSSGMSIWLIYRGKTIATTASLRDGSFQVVRAGNCTRGKGGRRIANAINTPPRDVAYPLHTKATPINYTLNSLGT